jgi:hypothetical protein
MVDKLVRIYMGVRFEVHTSLTVKCDSSDKYIPTKRLVFQDVVLCWVVNGYPYCGGVLYLHLLGHVVMEALLSCLTLMVEALHTREILVPTCSPVDVV